MADNLKVPLVGSAKLLNILVGAWGQLFVGLFTNDHTPDDADTLADFTEPSEPWYVRQPIQSWDTVGPDGEGREETTGETGDWVITSPASPVNIYGWFAVDADGDLLFEQREPDAPVVMATVGQRHNVTITFTTKSEF